MAGCGRDTPPPPLPYLSDEATILAFGDSLTHGTGANSDEAYPTVLASLINRQVVTVATPGDETKDGLEKLPGALERHEPDLLLLCLGGNDLLRRRSQAQIRDNLEKLINLARERGVPVVLLGVPEASLFGLQAHPMYGELAEQYQLPLENDILAEVLGDRKTKSDTIHPNAQGYARVAEAVATLLRRAGGV